MNATANTEYRKLALDSSNDMIDHDADRTLGRYPKAAWHILQAGFGRLRMGQMMFDAGEFTQAAADWLSAASCFYLATDPNRMRVSFDCARKLDEEGKIPSERRDLHAALTERERELQTLANKLSEFQLEYHQRVGPTGTADPETLGWLLRQVRELPGSPHLHADISGQAMALDQRALAVESLAWARRFDPSSPHLATLRTSQLFSFGEADKAAELARAILADYPQMDGTRFLLAQAIAFRAGHDPNKWRSTDWEEAITELEPLLRYDAPDTLTKLMAVGLLATVSHALGNEAEYRRALAAFDKLADSLSEPLAPVCATQLRQAMPQVFPQPGSIGVNLPSKPDYLAIRGLFEQFRPLAGSAV